MHKQGRIRYLHADAHTSSRYNRVISSRICSFPPCLSCFYMVSFGLPTHVRILVRSCPIMAEHLRLNSGNGDMALYHLRTSTRNLACQTDQAAEGQHYTYIILQNVCDTLVGFMNMEVMLPETILEKKIMLLFQDAGVNHWSFKTGPVNT